MTFDEYIIQHFEGSSCDFFFFLIFSLKNLTCNIYLPELMRFKALKSAVCFIADISTNSVYMGTILWHCGVCVCPCEGDELQTTPHVRYIRNDRRSGYKNQCQS